MDRIFMFIKKFVPGGYLSLPRGYIHVFDHKIQTSSSLKPLCINGQGHMTKMAAMASNSKKPLKIFFSMTL